MIQTTEQSFVCPQKFLWLCLGPLFLLYCLKMVYKKSYDCLLNRDLNTQTLKLSQYFYQSSNCIFYFKSNMMEYRMKTIQSLVDTLFKNS